MKKQLKGFTLIELIIVVAILAVLVSILVVALNPGEQLARARDAKRVADLDGIKSAINLYTSTATGTVNLSGDSPANNRCFSNSAPTLFVNTGGAVATSTGLPTTVTSTAQTVATSTATAAIGWLPVLLGQTPGGAPLSVLPLDPTNGTGANTSFFYAYGCKGSSAYELTARLESAYYKTDLNLIGTDGGNSTSTYETGTDLTIIPNGQ